MMRPEENSLKELEERQKLIPITPCATSYRMGWKGMQAIHWGKIPASELSLPPVSWHGLALTLRPPEKLNLQIDGLKLDRPLPTGSIHVVPAGSPALVSWQGSWDVVGILPRAERSCAGRDRVVRFRSNADGGATAGWLERA